jgi:hypothetical protein
MSYVQTKESMSRSFDDQYCDGRLGLGAQRRYPMLECLIIPLAQG